MNARWTILGSVVMLGFALVALLLSVVGLYGLIAYTVAQQKQEIGVRMALGARQSEVWRTVLVRSEVLPDRTFEATVFFTGATVDPQTRTARLRAVVDNSDVRLRPGMFVEVELPGAAASPVLQVPEASLQNHSGESFVFVHQGDETFERREVTTGRRSGGFIEVVSGLKPDERVVASGGFALKSRMLADLMAGD